MFERTHNSVTAILTPAILTLGPVGVALADDGVGACCTRGGCIEVTEAECVACPEADWWLCAGDANGDGFVDISDPVFVLGYLFRSKAPPPCMESANSNDDSALDIADVVYTLGYIFRDGAAPPAPFPQCGPDPEPGNSLGCLSSPACEGQ